MKQYNTFKIRPMLYSIFTKIFFNTFKIAIAILLVENCYIYPIYSTFKLNFYK